MCGAFSLQSSPLYGEAGRAAPGPGVLEKASIDLFDAPLLHEGTVGHGSALRDFTLLPDITLVGNWTVFADNLRTIIPYAASEGASEWFGPRWQPLTRGSTCTCMRPCVGYKAPHRVTPAGEVYGTTSRAGLTAVGYTAQR